MTEGSSYSRVKRYLTFKRMLSRDYFVNLNDVKKCIDMNFLNTSFRKNSRLWQSIDLVRKSNFLKINNDESLIRLGLRNIRCREFFNIDETRIVNEMLCVIENLDERTNCILE